tara:strand:- start:297 stop:443 length:147 start_codon:yes stop_codon:yes gene_type:complete
MRAAAGRDQELEVAFLQLIYALKVPEIPFAVPKHAINIVEVHSSNCAG